MANHLTYKDNTFRVGDSVQVHQLVREGDKERLQIFEGILIAVRGRGQDQSFTVRKIAAGAIGVERIWPVHTPKVVAIKLKRTGVAHRAKLYYLRTRKGKTATRLKERTEKPAPPVKAVVKKPAVKKSPPKKISPKKPAPKKVSKTKKK